jgi:hypothetical protein
MLDTQAQNMSKHRTKCALIRCKDSTKFCHALDSPCSTERQWLLSPVSVPAISVMAVLVEKKALRASSICRFHFCSFPTDENFLLSVMNTMLQTLTEQRVPLHQTH